jgi:hypothetical protein
MRCRTECVSADKDAMVANDVNIPTLSNGVTRFGRVGVRL